LNRQRESTPPAANDPFDAPVPNETYREEGDGEGMESQEGGGEEEDEEEGREGGEVDL